MLNIIKMDLKRLFQTRSLYLILFILFLWPLLWGLGMSKILKTPEVVPAPIVQELIVKLRQPEEAFQFIISTLFVTVLMFQAIFIVFFVHRELKTGFLKNVALDRTTRMAVGLSKTLCNLITLSLALIVALVAAYLTTFFLSGSWPQLSAIAKLGKPLGLRFCMGLAFSQGVIFFTYLSQQAVLMTVAVLLMCSNLYPAFLQLLARLLALAPDSLTRWSLTSLCQSTELATALGGSELTRILLLAGLSFFLYNGLTAWRLRRMDIR